MRKKRFKKPGRKPSLSWNWETVLKIVNRLGAIYIVLTGHHPFGP